MKRLKVPSGCYLTEPDSPGSLVARGSVGLCGVMSLLGRNGD